MSNDFVQSLIVQKLLVDDLESQLKAAKRELEEISSALSDYWETEGVHSQAVTVEGQKYTAYRTRSLQASVPKANRQQLIEVCEQMGFDDLVETTVGTAQLKSRLVEMMGPPDDDKGYDYDAIPPEIYKLVSLFEKKKVAIRKG